MHADILRWRGLRHSTRAAHALGSSSKPGHQTQAGKHNPPSQGWESSCLWGAGGCSARAQPRQGEPLLHPQRAGRPGHTAAAAAAAQVVPGRAGSAHLVLRRVGPRCQPAAARTSRAGAGRGALVFVLTPPMAGEWPGANPAARTAQTSPAPRAGASREDLGRGAPLHCVYLLLLHGEWGPQGSFLRGLGLLCHRAQASSAGSEDGKGKEQNGAGWTRLGKQQGHLTALPIQGGSHWLHSRDDDGFSAVAS